MISNNLIELRTLLDKASPEDRANLAKSLAVHLFVTWHASRSSLILYFVRQLSGLVK